jgi:hypothetical protein
MHVLLEIIEEAELKEFERMGSEVRILDGDYGFGSRDFRW